MKTEFNVGDKIVVVCGLKSEKCKFYNIGDIGIIKHIYAGEVIVNFNDQNNTKVYYKGVSVLRREYIRKYVEQEKPRFHNAQPGDLLWNDELGICRIDSIDCGQNYPISVISDNSSDLITLEGKRYLESPKATFFYYSEENHYLTERPEPKYEVDWSKVPSGVDVKVSNVHQKDALKNLKYTLGYKFMGYFPDLVLPFWVFRTYEKTEAFGVKFCALAEPCKPEWRK